MQHWSRGKIRVQYFLVRLEAWINPGFSRTILCFLTGFSAAVLPDVTVALEDPCGSNLVSIAELESKVTERGRAIESFKIEGVVCAVVPQQSEVVLQDASETALLKLPSANEKIGIGDWLELQGDHCTLTRSRTGIEVGTAPVVDNDGTHAALKKSGSVFLETGQHPICLSWFNRQAPYVLNVEYEGDDVPRQNIPFSMLWCQTLGSADRASFQHGLKYSAYAGKDWYSLPKFDRLDPVAEGIATNFNVSDKVRGDNPALVFHGFLEIDRPGLYKFYVESADGSRLYVGDPVDYCKVIVVGRRSAPVVANFVQVLDGAVANRWAGMEGTVGFVGQSDDGIELEISERTVTIQATILSGAVASFTNLLHRQVHAAGICEASRDLAGNKTVRLLIPCADQIKILQSANESVSGNSIKSSILTAASQVQRLKPTEARKHVSVRIKGVVTQASPTSLVLQDVTGGVFVHYSPDDWTGQPRIGDIWQVEGTTDPGDFSPVVYATNGIFFGSGTMPEPIRPTWDQLMNGSLDAQYVELQGVVTAVSDTALEILTRDGRIEVTVDEMRKSYVDGRDLFVHDHVGVVPVDDVSRTYVGSIVKIRGCLVALWNPETRQVKAGEIRLVAAVVDVEEPRPQDPFVHETRKAADLLLFDPNASALERTKISGQIVYARSREYFIQDEQTGIRAVTEEVLPLQAGDFVEAVGYPQLGGGSPVLLEAQIRKTGAAKLPVPMRVALTNLLDRKLDSTLVEIEAVLLSDTMNRDQRVLEVQAGPHHFLARLDSFRTVWESLATGSRLKLTGVYTSVTEDRGNSSLDSFELLLNHPADIVVLQKPSWWTVRHMVAVIATLVVVLGLALVWITSLRKKVEERTLQLQKEIEERQLVEQHRAIDQERTRVAQDLHDELGAGLTEVSILGSLAKTQAIPPEAKEHYVDQLTDVARSLVATLDEIVWAVNPHYDSVASLATYYSLFAQRFLNMAGIACRLHVSETIPEHALDSRIRHGVFRAFKEALNNVVRHSGATEVRLTIEVSNEQLLLCVKDNGCGFDASRKEPGADGLMGLCQRMQKLGGSSQIASQSGTGTTVELRLPLKGK